MKISFRVAAHDDRRASDECRDEVEGLGQLRSHPHETPGSLEDVLHLPIKYFRIAVNVSTDQKLVGPIDEQLSGLSHDQASSPRSSCVTAPSRDGTALSPEYVATYQAPRM